jgi:hypothetical protein
MKILLVIALLASASLAQVNPTPFERMYDKERVIEKQAIWRGLTKAEQVEARRANFQWGIAHLNLTGEQIEYLNRFGNVLPTITKRDARDYELEAIELFPKLKAQLLFGSIGPFTDQCNEQVFVKVRSFYSTCPCSRGSSFNMSCRNECAAGGCMITPDGCGFAWLFACDGSCQVSWIE